MPATIDQPMFSAAGVVNEPVVIEAEKVQDCRLEIVGGHDMFDRAVTDFVAGPIGHACLDPAPREPDGETLAVVVATGGRIGIALSDRKPTNLSAPVHEGGVEQPTLLEIFDKGRGRLVGSSADRRERAFDAGMSIPGLATEEDLDESHASFYESAGDQTPRPVLAGLVLVQSVERSDVSGLVRDVEGLFCGRLHGGSELRSSESGFRGRTRPDGFGGAFD